MDMHEFITNRNQFPPEELWQYAGQYIAWSPDGRSILASDHDEIALYEAILALGYESGEVVVSSVPYPDEIILGGGALDP
jgi:hypothetical protein